MLNPFKIVEKILRSKPGPSLTFSEIHVFEAIDLIGKEKAVGRIKLAKKLGLGEGAVRTLLKHLKKHGLIKVYPKIGCKLTGDGEKIFRIIGSRIVGPVKIPKNPLTVGAYNVCVLVREAANVVGYGLEQRDAAVKVGALGATTLIYKQSILTMPGVEENCFKNYPEIQNMLISTLQPKENDVIIIGTANNQEIAKIGAKAAAIETLKRIYAS